MRHERLALAVVVLLVVIFPAALFGYQAWRTSAAGARVIAVEALAPDKGGWQPGTIRVNAGERVRLRVSAVDVVHSLEIPALGIDSGEILPGHVVELDLVAEKPGRYAFACTRWCSLDHWRMRGVLEVVDPANPDAAGVKPGAMPLYQQLGIDLDAMRNPVQVPAGAPSAAHGAALSVTLPAGLEDAAVLRRTAPADAFARMRADAANQMYSDPELWDAVAWLWQSKLTTPEALARGQELFRQDCAACHGETGRGDGPAGRDLPGLAAMHPEMKRGPADFTNLSQMATASDVLLEGKLLRGGMGTGMPEFGSLYSERERWDVIAYVRSLAFGK